MTRGRKPKPTELKVLEGNPGKRALNHDEPKPEGDIGDPPAWMSDDQKKIWTEAVKDAPPGLLTCLDKSVFTVWVVAVDQHQKAAIKVSKFGAVVKSPSTGAPIKSPFVTILNQQAAVIQKAVSEMGFSPTARTRVKVDKAPQGADPFADLMAITD